LRIAVKDYYRNNKLKILTKFEQALRPILESQVHFREHFQAMASTPFSE